MAHPVFCPVSAVAICLGAKRPEREADYSFTYCRGQETSPPILRYAFMACCIGTETIVPFQVHKGVIVSF